MNAVAVVKRTMISLDEIQEYSETPEAITFAEQWIQEHRAGDITGEYHMNLLAWHSTYPAQAFAITLALLRKVEADDWLAETVTTSVVDYMFEWAPDEFVPVLCEAINRVPVIEMCTRAKRQDPKSNRWQELCRKSGAKAGEGSPHSVNENISNNMSR